MTRPVTGSRYRGRMDNTAKVIDLQAFRLASRRTPGAEPGSEARVLRPSFDGSGRTRGLTDRETDHRRRMLLHLAARV